MVKSSHQRSEVLRLWALGWIGSKIAKKIGISRSAVHGQIDRARRDGIHVQTRVVVDKEKSKVQVRKRRAPSRRTKPTPLPVEKPASDWRGITIHNLTHTTCRYPMWKQNEHRLYCGKICAAANPYCTFHTEVADR